MLYRPVLTYRPLAIVTPIYNSILALRKARENILSSGSIKLFYKYTRSRMYPKQ